MSSISELEEKPSVMQTGVTMAVTALMCLLISILLWAFVPAMGGFRFIDVFAHSMSIGLIAAALTIGVTGWLSPARRSSIVWLTACLIPVSFSAFVLGSLVAKLLIGAPIRPLSLSFAADDIVSLTTTVFATALCAGFFISREQLNRLKLRAAQDGQRAETAKLAMLQAQVEPHMLFNTLANLRALITVDPDRALVMLDQLDGFLRLTLEGSRSLTNPLSKEFLGLDHYLSIMQIRLGDRLRYTLDLPTALEHLKVPSLLIQPVVENAIRHGIEPKVGGGAITVSARLDDDILTIEVTDTGVGFQPAGKAASSRPGGGFGLESLRQRLPSINGQTPMQTISPLPDGSSGTKVVMKVRT